MPRRPLRRLAVLCVALLSIPGAADNQPPAPPPSAPKAEPMSPATREYLRKMMSPGAVSHRVRNTLREKMKKHGGEWRELSWAAVLADYAEVERTTGEMMKDPRIAMDPGQIAGLGDAFFLLQEELRTRALALKQAAAAKDPKAVAVGLGQLVDTCATCHAIYRSTPEAR